MMTGAGAVTSSYSILPWLQLSILSGHRWGAVIGNGCQEHTAPPRDGPSPRSLPSDGRGWPKADRLSPYSYFNGARAAFLEADNTAAALDSKMIRFPAAYVLSGDTLWTGSSTNDADKDDYVQNCVGGPTNGVPAKGWEIHSKGQNILFEDGHAKWCQGYSPAEKTFRYDAMHGWP
jgi:hypothetical protein